MAWTLKVFNPTDKVTATPLATYSDTSPGGIVGPFTWRRKADGDCIDLTFRAIQALTPIAHRQVVLLTVDSVNVFAGLIVQRPGSGDLAGDYVAVGMRELLNNTTMAITKYAGTNDIANIVRSVLSTYAHSAVIFDSTLVIASTGASVTEYNLPIVTMGALFDAFIAATTGLSWGVNADGKAFFNVPAGTDTFNANSAKVEYDQVDSSGLVRGVIGVAANTNNVGTIRPYNMGNVAFTTYSAGDFGTYATSQAIVIPPELLTYYPVYRAASPTTSDSSVSGIQNTAIEASWTNGPSIYTATHVADMADNDMATSASGLWTMPASTSNQLVTVFRAPVGVIPFAFEITMNVAPAGTIVNFDSIPPGIADTSFTFGNYGIGETVRAIRHGIVATSSTNSVLTARYVFGWPGNPNVSRSSNASNHWRARISCHNNTTSGAITYYTARFIGIANGAWTGYVARLFPGIVATPLRTTRSGYVAPSPNVSISNVPNIGTLNTTAEGYEYSLDNYGLITMTVLAPQASIDSQSVNRLVDTTVNGNDVSKFSSIVLGGDK